MVCIQFEHINNFLLLVEAVIHLNIILIRMFVCVCVSFWIPETHLDFEVFYYLYLKT